MATLTNIYADLDLTFAAQPVTGDVSLVLDGRAVINSVRNLLLTNFYERPWQTNLGSNLTGLLFEPVSSITQNIIAKEIENTIKNFEPRVTLNFVNVTANYDETGYNVTLNFYIGNYTEPTQVTLFLERIR